MMMDLMTGSLEIKKGEPWMDTISPTITYLLRHNTNVTSLLSGQPSISDYILLVPHIEGTGSYFLAPNLSYSISWTTL